jgi:hypothetical protein
MLVLLAHLGPKRGFLSKYSDISDILRVAWPTYLNVFDVVTSS